MNRRLLLVIGGIGILIVLLIIGIIGIRSSPSNTQKGSQTFPSATEDDDTAATITYTGRSFEPNNVSVKVGDQIRVRNRSIRVLDFASAPYTDNSYYPELNIGTLNPSEDQTFYVSQKGSWTFINNLDPSETGVIVVR